MIQHRTVTALLALAGLMLTACSAGPAGRPAADREAVRDRLASADGAPYSAALRAVTRSGSQRLQLTVGRINLNAPLTGRTTDRTQQYTEDVVITERTVYRRAVGAHGAWQEFPASTAKGGLPVDRLPQYVRLMLDHSTSIRQGSEAVRVSARLTPREIASVDETAGRNLGPAGAIDADAWIDGQGRVVRVRQIIHVESGSDIHATVTLTDFGKPVPVRPPVTR
ncbi:hypothetical protein ACFY3O_29940 [Streptomyces sp. NPDC001046]|uniref:hypothetical protein n=1 Tax=unclassified Streptomyces TaxID=2593676 RepID=UPI0036300D2F